MTTKIMTVVGTRPEAIKMIPVIRALRGHPNFAVSSVTTGQHREMLDQVFRAFGETSDLDLGIMTKNQSLASITSSVLSNMMKTIELVRPDVILVHGDTTTAMAAALAGFYSGVKLGHVEAGLRSGDLKQPWPEEFNRVTIDSISDFLFAPTEISSKNLSQEYNRRGKVYVTGNTGIDSLLLASSMLNENSRLGEEYWQKLGPLSLDRRLILVTGQRRENFGDGFERICNGLLSIAERDDVQIIYPVHLNPNVRKTVHEKLAARENIILIEPVDYFEMVWLMKRAYLIITDSGGIQEEAPALGKPVLVMRETTERPEALTTGLVKLIGTDPISMKSEADRLLDNERLYQQIASPAFPYGDGSAANRIAHALLVELTGYQPSVVP